jgi:tRNA (adenine37-N6)-methyltransferase
MPRARCHGWLEAPRGAFVELAEGFTRHPRNNPNWPAVGIFAQRGKNRPNRLGTTVCRVLRVEGAPLHVEGLDAINGTPVLDIKPWVREFGPRGDIAQPAWMDALMRGDWR